MRTYTNKLGIVCVEPDEGYLLEKNGQLYKKVYLGKNDRAELYNQVKDENYRVPKDNGSIKIDISDKTADYILLSPGGKQFKLIVSDDGTLSTKEI